MNPCSPKEIKELLDRHGFHFSKSLGQNFLIDESVPRRIADGSGVNKNYGVLEIGPGIGALTQFLCQNAAQVTSIELDKSLPPLLAETIGEYDNFHLVMGDAMKLDLKAVLDENMPGLKYAVCANLPYNITSPIITKFIECGMFDSITVMIQREVAHRICAKAGDEDYGAFSVFADYHAETEILFDVPPSCFMPQPKVHSSVIKLVPRKEKKITVIDENMFFRVVRACFAQRRKTLVNGLYSGFSDCMNKEKITQILTDLGHSPTVRGEKLSTEQFGKIADKFTAFLK